MMYNNKLAVAVKNNGNVVKDNGDTVLLPFGSEYSIYIKNLNTVKAVVKISIDGTDVCSGGFVVYPNSSIDIERFVKDNDTGNRFKFIERTAGIEKTRGVGVEDGLIRIEYQFAKPENPILTWNGPVYRHPQTWNSGPQPWNSGPTYGTGNPPQDFTITTSNAVEKGILRSRSASSAETPVDATVMSVQSMAMPVNDAGITVPGSISDQKFTQVADFPLESTKHVMVVKVLGVTEDDVPVEVVTPSRKKIKCVTCQHVNKASYKFCVECGTSLIVI